MRFPLLFTDSTRPFVLNSLLVVIAGLFPVVCQYGAQWQRRKDETEADDRETRWTLFLVTSLTIVVPAIVSMLFHGLFYRTEQRSLRERYDRTVQLLAMTILFQSAEQEQAERMQQLQERSDWALDHARDYTQLPLHRVTGMIGTSLALLIQSVLRLFVGRKNFGSDAAEWNFGPLFGVATESAAAGAAGDGSDTTMMMKALDTNELFQPAALGRLWGQSPFVNVVAGLVAAFFIFPAVVRGLPSLICRCQEGRNGRGIWRKILRTLPILGTLWPVQLCARLLLRHREAFATSTFGVEVFEWGWGYLVGLAFGDLWTAVTVWRRGMIARQIDRAAQPVVDTERGRNMVDEPHMSDVSASSGELEEEVEIEEVVTELRRKTAKPAAEEPGFFSFLWSPSNGGESVAAESVPAPTPTPKRRRGNRRNRWPHVASPEEYEQDNGPDMIDSQGWEQAVRAQDSVSVFSEDRDYDDSLEYVERQHCCRFTFDHATAIVLFGTLIVSSVFTVWTWHSCRTEDDTSCINYQDNQTNNETVDGEKASIVGSKEFLTVLFLVVPILVMICARISQVRA